MNCISMKIFALTVICFSMFLTASAQKKDEKKEKTDTKITVVKEGVGFNGIIVGKSTLKDVEKKFGKDFRTIKHKKYSVQMRYSNGLSFYACQADKSGIVFDIEIRQPFKAKTGKGIILGKSTVEDVRKTYGKSIGDKTEEDLEFRGVSFFYSATKGKKIITVIDIVENKGIRQCDKMFPQNK